MARLLKNLFVFCAVTAGFVVAMGFVAWGVRPNLKARPSPYSSEQIAAAEKARDVSFDPEHTPTLYRKIDVTPTSESPMLREMVEAGDLPPLAQRMPKHPAVIEGPDGIGKFGGTWLRLANGPDDVAIITNRMSAASFTRWSPLGYPIEPHVARRIESSADARAWTITLREGMRWSDGAPYTADDVLYWWNEEANNKTVSAVPPPWMIASGKPGRIEKLGDYQFKITFDQPNPTLPEQLAVVRDGCESPAHYLRQFHPDPEIGDARVCEQLMRAYNMPSRRALYTFIKLWQNPDHPRLWPWIYRTYRPTPPQVFVRNPYYFMSDPKGNQLPYLDRLQFEVQDPKMLGLTAANGGASMQDRFVRFADYTEIMSRRRQAGTHVLHWYPASRSVWVINPNLNRIVDPADPSSKWKAQLLNDKRFRQAMSLAIDREQIIRADQYGVGEPSQVAPGPQSRFSYPPLAHAFTAHDPARCNALLDELHLTERDSEGFRTFPDGSRMVFYLDFTGFTEAGPAQFVVDDWAAVGVRAILRERNRSLFYVEKDSMQFDFNVWSGESDIAPLVSPRYFIAFNTEAFYAVGWGRWFQRGGMYDAPESKVKGSIPVPREHPMHAAMEAFDEALRSPALAVQKELMNRVLEIAAENVWSISISVSPPQLVVVKDGFRNVPSNALYGFSFSTPANAGMEAFFFDQPQDSAGALAESKASILTATPRPGGASLKKSAAPSLVSQMLRWGVLGIVLLSLVLVGLRHPFIARRLAIMLPTLAVISVVVFIIIQLPPGDFLSSKIIKLSQSGDDTDLRDIEDLKEQFHFDEPAWRQYTRWMGLDWFLTYQAQDTGLLQGNMGRSMETAQPVNDIVGDRILLTVLLSLGTILFTWIVALPIGIYSAVRQYSVSDYVLTLIGFIGMCIPAFLLALVLMAASGVAGLFSPQFAAQPEWTGAKVLDLLSHLWIPVIVLGVGGTAGMIRVMRANLLDELKKPYVITAMAKGVRPMRLLIKYPVRMALNPFVSGIGALFPQLISGGAIVSMVLALPTVGPELIRGLLNEDMYLAGSMLMVLSILGVLGTLVSDLLLLWLDPRIRFKGGTR